MRSIWFINIQLYRCSCGQCYRFVRHCWWFKQNWLSIQRNPSIYQINLLKNNFVFNFSPKMNFNPENLYEVITSLLVLFWGLFAVFFFCECGKIVSTQFTMFDHDLWQCNWYLFPIEMRRLLALVMSNTQNPATLFSYGNFECTRDTFKRVINKKFPFIQIAENYDLV